MQESLFLLYEQAIGNRCGTVLSDESLQEHIKKVAQGMHMRNPPSLITPSDSFLSAVYQDRQMRLAWVNGPVSSFGNTLLPGMAPSISVDPPFISSDLKKFFATRSVARLKTNDPLLARIVPLVVGIAATLLLLPTFPTAGWVIGLVAVLIVDGRFSLWNQKRIQTLVEAHSTAEEMLAAVQWFEEQKEGGGAMAKAVLDRQISSLKAAMARKSSSSS